LRGIPHQCFHFPYRLGEADKQRMRDDGVANVEFGYPRYGSDRLDVPVMQPMSGIDFQSHGETPGHREPDTLELFLLLTGSRRVGIMSGVYLDGGSARLHRCVDLIRIRVDEKRYLYAFRPHEAAGSPHRLQVPHHVQATLRGQFFPALRDEAYFLGLDAQREFNHFVRYRAFKVHAGFQYFPQDFHIALLDVAAVFPQMQRNRVGACCFRGYGSFHGIGINGAARLAQRGYVINIDAKFGHDF
jgi:hypothetical protein